MGVLVNKIYPVKGQTPLISKGNDYGDILCTNCYRHYRHGSHSFKLAFRVNVSSAVISIGNHKDTETRKSIANFCNLFSFSADCLYSKFPSLTGYITGLDNFFLLSRNSVKYHLTLLWWFCCQLCTTRHRCYYLDHDCSYLHISVTEHKYVSMFDWKKITMPLLQRFLPLTLRLPS